MLVVRRIHASYDLKVDDDVDQETVERVHGFHARFCPVARSIRDAIEITTSLTVRGGE